VVGVEADVVVVGVGPLETAPVLTQYACPSQKLVKQSRETAGFHFRKSSKEMPYLAGTDWQSSPDTTVCQPLQLAGWPSWTGAPGWLSCASTTLPVHVATDNSSEILMMLSRFARTSSSCSLEIQRTNGR
jgi:hypothetical protein